MRLKIEADRWADGIGYAVQAAGRGEDLRGPGTGALLRATHGKGLEVECNDGTRSMRVACTAEVEEEGAAVVSARTLQAMARHWQAGESAEVSVEAGGHGSMLSIRIGRGRYSIQALDESHALDPIGEGEAGRHIRFGRRRLLAAVEGVRRFQASHDVRYYLNGIKMERRPGRLRLVATNGHALALAEAPAKWSEEEAGDTLIPCEAMRMVAKMLSEEEGDEVGWEIASGRVEVSGAAGTLQCRPIDGRYPDYEKVLPAAEAAVGRIEVETAALAAGIAQVRAVAAGEGTDGRVELRAAEDGLWLESASGEEGGRIFIEAAPSGDPPEVVACNGLYLGWMADSLATERAVIHLKGPGDALLVTGEGERPEEVDLRYVVMPLR